MNTTLLLEGGGMRGLYTCGVLDYFLEKELQFTSCVGVSAGACTACSFLSKQPFRAAQINIDYMRDKRCFGFSNLLKKGSIFDYDFMFETVAKQLMPFDYDTFNKRTCDFYAVSTDMATAKPIHKKIESIDKDIAYLCASMALPMLSYPLKADGMELLDGGISDSIPIDFTLSLKADKNIVVLTQHRNYVKGTSRIFPLLKRKYRKYPNLVKALENRHIQYNETMKQIYALEKQGKIFIIQPKKPITLSRLEKNPATLKALYDVGYQEAKDLYHELMVYLEG